jgi:hypothetical protein
MDQSRRWLEMLGELTGELKAQNGGSIEIVVRYEDHPIRTVDLAHESELLQ